MKHLTRNTSGAGTVDAVANFPIGSLLRHARRLADMSQRQLAKAARVPPSVVAALESTNDPGRVTLAAFLRLLRATGCAVTVVGPDGTPLMPLPDGPRDRAGRRYPAHLDVRPVRNLYDWWAWQHHSTWAKPPLPKHSFDLDREMRNWRRTNPETTDSPHYVIRAAARWEEMRRREAERRHQDMQTPLEPVDDDYWTDDVDP